MTASLSTCMYVRPLPSPPLVNALIWLRPLPHTSLVDLLICPGNRGPFCCRPCFSLKLHMACTAPRQSADSTAAESSYFWRLLNPMDVVFQKKALSDTNIHKQNSRLFLDELPRAKNDSRFELK